MSAKILIVEDEQLVAADLESKLERLGYTVVGVAASGPDALHLAREFHPEVILMDIQLQGPMDGITAARLMNEIVDTKVIFVSAFAQLSRVGTASIAQGSYINKPFSLAQLRAVVASAIGDR